MLEVTIAAFIFSIVSISFLGVWGQQVRSLEKSRHLMVATFLAEELIEESMTDGYERTRLTEPATGLVEVPITIVTEFRSPDDPEEWDEIPVTYITTREVKTYVPPGSTDPDDEKVKQVIVRVKWQDTTKTGEVVLETFLAGVQ